jgi:hypothetical protein
VIQGYNGVVDPGAKAFEFDDEGTLICPAGEPMKSS